MLLIEYFQFVLFAARVSMTDHSYFNFDCALLSLTTRNNHESVSVVGGFFVGWFLFAAVAQPTEVKPLTTTDSVYGTATLIGDVYTYVKDELVLEIEPAYSRLVKEGSKSIGCADKN